MGRLRDLVRFYDLLDRLSQQIGGPRLLAQSTGRHGWPQRGVYFFFEPDALRRAEPDIAALFDRTSGRFVIRGDQQLRPTKPL